jgi:hypothetical protein
MSSSEIPEPNNIAAALAWLGVFRHRGGQNLDPELWDAFLGDATTDVEIRDRYFSALVGLSRLYLGHLKNEMTEEQITEHLQHAGLIAGDETWEPPPSVN